MEFLTNLLNLNSLSVVDAGVIIVILWIRADLNKNTKALENGIVKQMSDLTMTVALLGQNFNLFKESTSASVQAMKEDCEKHREHERERRKELRRDEDRTSKVLVK